MSLPEMISGGAAVLATGYAWWMHRRADAARAVTIRELHLREQLEAYSKVDVTLSRTAESEPVAMRELAGRVCRTIAEKSVFRRVMLLMRNAEGRLPCVGSIGVDDLTVAALERWGEKVVEEERGTESGNREKSGMARDGALLGKTAAFQIQLGQWSEFDEEVATWKLSGKTERRQWRRAIVMPVRTKAVSELRAGRLVGVIVVCSDGLRLPPEERGSRFNLERVVGPLEVLAARLGRAAETLALQERVVRAEKLAGLGQLAGGVAQALDNPLTVVLGYAEIMAETSAEPRVRDQARRIMQEAGRMRSTVQRLGELWQPAEMAMETVDLVGLVRQVTQEFGVLLAEQGVRLDFTSQLASSLVNGNADRLEQMVGHLLEYALASIEAGRRNDTGEEQVVRVSLTQDEPAVHLIVSHTGVAPAEAARVFEPQFAEGDAVGTGLAVCYGIVRDHGGEIAAFPLHPRGGAVVVDLPAGELKAEARMQAVGRGIRD